MKHYLESAESVFQEVSSNEAGLTSAEAAARLEKNGKNKLAEAKKDSTLKKFFDQMKDPMIIILIFPNRHTYYSCCCSYQCNSWRFAGKQGGKGC